MTVADRIKYLREINGWTQDELAERMGYSTKSSISKIETSGNDITLKKITKLAKVLHTSESYLMGWVANPDPAYLDTKEGMVEQFNSQVHETEQNMENVRNMILEESGAYPEHVDIATYVKKHEEQKAKQPSYNAEQIAKALELYEKYQNAIPQVQAAVETLLKGSQSDS